ncbi:MAG: M20 family peptidase [Promethearchaeota archaeon]|nr:MAG: M20 family peptidase [Candidatus Lokiarchaeota archaeon]
MSEELIIKEIDDNKEEYIEFLRGLIKAKSYNPPGDEKNVALKIKDYLNGERIKCEILPFGDNRANLLAFLNDNFNYKNLLYNGHMDVVPPGNEEEWKNPPLSATIKRNKLIFGRGTTDMKGPLAAMIIALKILKKLDLNLSGNLILNAVADEETGGKFGTKWSLDNKLNEIKCNFSVIGEPSGLNPLPKAIILGEKGHLQIRIITNGISCHSSTPFIGENAIYMMSNIIQNLDNLEKYIPKVKPPLSLEELKKLISESFPSEEIFERIYSEQPLLQNVVKSLTQFTKSLNMINGGIKENVVPDRCEAIIDFRLLPDQTTEDVIDALKKVIKDLGYQIRDEPLGKPEDVFVYLDIFNQNEASYWKDWESSADLKMFHNIVEKIYKKKPFNFLFPACADAHYLRNKGYCPATILFGPGSAATAHAINEYIEIQDFINAIKVYTLFAYNFLKESND